MTPAARRGKLAAMTAFACVAAAHVFGVAVWTGAVLSAALLLRDGRNEPAARVLKTVAARGMEIALLAGAGLALFRPGFYLSQPWFHLKLVFAASAVGFHLALLKLSGAGAAPPRPADWLGAGFGASALAAVLLAFLQP